MTNQDADFDTWFDALAVAVLDGSGVDFTDQASVADDYAQGRDAFDVADEINQEYSGA